MTRSLRLHPDHRPLMRLAFIVLLLLGGAAPILAARIHFAARVDGEPVAGGEICIRQARASGTPFEIFASTNDIRCVQAGKLIDIPPGAWVADITHPDGYVSRHPLVIQGGTDPAPIRTLEVELHRSAAIDFSSFPGMRARGEFPAVYVPNSDRPGSPGMIRPLPEGESLLVVPAEVDVVPLIVRDAEPVWVGATMKLEIGEQRELAWVPPAADELSVVAWVKLDSATFDEIRASESLSSLSAELVRERGTIPPLIPVRRGADVELQLLLFHTKSRDPVRVRLWGRTWEIDEVVAVPSGVDRVLFISEPLRATPASSVVVTWDDFGNIDPQRRRSCDGSAPGDSTETGAPPTVLVRLLRCPDLQAGASPDPVARNGCQTAAADELPLSDESRTIQFDSVTAGRYVIELTHPALEPYAEPIYAEAGDVSEIHFESRHGAISGQVVLESSPVHAEIHFWSGSAVSDPVTGDYYALLTEAPHREPIAVTLCGSGEEYFVLPDEPLVLNQSYDVVLPDNKLEVMAIDAPTGAALSGARIDLFVDATGSRDSFSPPSRFTDRTGKATFGGLPHDRTFSLCAWKDGYERECERSVAIRDGTTAEQVRLRPISTGQGRLLSLAPPVYGRITWFRRDGVVTEVASVKADGTFTFSGKHGEDEHAVFIAANLPLVVLTALPTFSKPVEIDIRAVRPVSFLAEDVTGRTAYIGLAINGIAVPSHLFVQHQNLRGAAAMFIDGGVVRIADVASAERIEVILGPHPVEAAALAGDADWLFYPTYTAYPRKLVPRHGGRVRFD